VIEASGSRSTSRRWRPLQGDVVFDAGWYGRTIRRSAHRKRPVPARYKNRQAGASPRSIDTARGVVGADPTKPDLSKLPTDPFGTVEFRDGRMVASIGGKDVDS